MGKYSYVIFLFQMFYFFLIHGLIDRGLKIMLVDSVLLLITLDLLFCIVPVLWYKNKNHCS